MNHWQFEQYKQIDEISRQRIQFEVRAENLIRQLRIYRPGTFARMMFRLANWMIWQGKQIQRRYEIPETSCSQQTSRNLI